MSKTPQPLLQLSDFDYPLQTSQIAQHPLKTRDQSRLLIYQNQEVSHSHVYHLHRHLPQDSLLILNNSRTIASRLMGKTETGGQVEVFLMERPIGRNDKSICQVIGKPLKRFQEGFRVFFVDGLESIVTEHQEIDGGLPKVTMQFNRTIDEIIEWMDQNGFIPLPPYIKRDKPDTSSNDAKTYQTTFSKRPGSVATPTAGLHFTDEVFANLKAQNINVQTLELCVGGGTFLPVKSEEIETHKMHSERFLIPSQTAEAIIQALDKSVPIYVVGTTTFRAIESLWLASNQSQDDFYAARDEWQTTDLFIYPKHREDRYKSSIISGLMTNFHQPKSTLFMLIAALVGLEEALRIYSNAQDNSYRLFSYGDACLFHF